MAPYNQRLRVFVSAIFCAAAGLRAHAGDLSWIRIGIEGPFYDDAAFGLFKSLTFLLKIKCKILSKGLLQSINLPNLYTLQ